MSPAASGAVERTLMFREAASAAHAVRAQLEHDGANLAALGLELRRLAPRAVITAARGSSDHAATFAKYLIETRTGVLTASAAPSVSSVYKVAQNLGQCLFIAISQSGRSPDQLASVEAARSAGAKVLALCNSPGSPLVAAADWVIDLHAGAEHSIAATKSYLASLAALLRLVAAWTGDAALTAALPSLPSLMEQSWALDWSAAIAPLERAEHLFVVGRGLGLGAAQEVALKCKETCGLHAEAFSSAELRHGPYTLLGPSFPALLLAQSDATRAGVEALAAELARRGVPVLFAGDATPALRETAALLLPTLSAPPEFEPLLRVQSAYRLIAALALQRGFDPDHPQHLSKVTETV